MTTDTKMHRGALEVKAAKGRTVVGFGSTWDLDQYGDVIEPGAYARWLNEWQASGRMLSLLDNHRYDSTESALGVLTDAEENTKGLRTEFLVVEGPRGDHLLNQVKIGAVNAFSIGYEVRGYREPSENERKMGIQRVLQDIELMEVSAVLFPANRNATIEGIKAALKAGDITEEDAAAQIRDALTEIKDTKQLRGIASHIGSLLRPSAPSNEAAPEDEKDATPATTPDTADSAADEPEAVAPDDPKRLEVEAMLREIEIRSLAV